MVGPKGPIGPVQMEKQARKLIQPHLTVPDG